MSGLNLYVVTHAEIDKHWESILPLVEKCIKKAYHGEMNSDDALKLIKNNKAFAIVGFIDNEVVVAGIFQPVEYPQMKAISCIMAAGNRPGIMREISDQWMAKIREYAKSLNFDAIECWASDSMSKILAPMGYRKIYNLFRMEV